MPTTPPPPSSTDDRYRDAVAWCVGLYSDQGRFTRGYVQGKLLHDPVYRQLSESAPFHGPILDLGCGRGQTVFLLQRLRPGAKAHGIDWDLRKLELARRSASVAGLGEDVRFEAGDIRSIPYPTAGTILMLDVLHYHELEQQDAMLRRAALALTPGGRLFLRDVDASGSLRARINIWQERLGCLVRLNRGATLRFRSAQSIVAVLEGCGLETEVFASWRGTPLANVLIEARRP